MPVGQRVSPVRHLSHSCFAARRRLPSPPMDLNELARVLAAMGGPEDKTPGMASQLDKRARQLAEEKGRSYDEALTHLLQMMRQGWAAQERGF